MIYFYVYETTCILNQMIYVGVHSSESLEDEYLGSGLYIKRALKKYGRHNFRKRILSIHSSMEEALLEEKRIVTLDFVRRSDTFNLKEGGFGGRMGPEVIKKMRASAKILWEDPEVRAKRSQANKLKWESEEYRAKVSTAVKNSYTPELRSKKSVIMKRKAEDPEYLRRLSEGVSRSYEGDKGKELRRKRSEDNKTRWGSLSKEERSLAARKMCEANSRKVVCPYCGKEGSISNMKRWHFENCKEKD